jgi:heat-inducible transcriptional repressor
MLDERKAAILGALVEDHIASGTPVSSRSILERSGLECSSATIRNELVLLEQMGLVAQPHTSAGRTPTDHGFRYYVDHLSPGSLRASTRTRIADFFSSIHAEFGRILRETSELLSEITHYPAVVLGPGVRGHVVQDIHLLPVEPNLVALVLVTESGRVHQGMVRPDRPVTPDEVEDATDLLAGAVRGKQLGGEMPVPPDAGGAVGQLVSQALDAVAGALDRRREIYVGGASLMVDLWEDLAKLHRVLALLETEAAVLELFDVPADGTSVRLGSEIHAAEQDLAVVSSAYSAGRSTSRIGVLGPMRMDYRRAIRAVEEVSDALGDSLSP